MVGFVLRLKFKCEYSSVLVCIALILLVANQDANAAANQAIGITYTGRIMKSDGTTPVTSNNVSFSIALYDIKHGCILYTEARFLDLSTSDGTFSFDIGDGTIGTSPMFYGGSSSLSDLFNNKKTFTGYTNVGSNKCSDGSTSFIPGSDTEPRILMISFDVNDGSGVQYLPELKINPVPSAIQAYQVNGFGSDNLLKVDSLVDLSNGGAFVGNNSALTQSQYNEFWRLVKNPNTAYLTSATVGTLVGDVTGTISANTVAKIQGVSVSTTAPTNGQILMYNGSSWAPAVSPATGVNSITVSSPLAMTGTSTPNISIQQAGSTQDGYLSSSDWNTFNAKMDAGLVSGKMWVGNSGGVATAVSMAGDASLDNAGNVTLATTGVIAGTYNKVVVDAKGRVTSGSGLGSSDITTALGYTPVNRAGDSMTGDLITQNITMNANKYFGLSSNATDGTVAGQMWFDSGVIKYYDGSAVRSAVTSNTGFINGGNTFGGTASLGTNDNFPLNIKTNNSTVMYIGNNGDVGIGTTAPSAKLHIVDEGLGAWWNDNYSSAAGNNPAIIGRKANGTVTSPSVVLNNEPLLFLGGRGWYGSDFSSTSKASITMAANEDWSSTNQGARISFSTTANGTTSAKERLRIDNNGYVGIGTSTPTTNMEVRGGLALSHSSVGVALYLKPEDQGGTYTNTPDQRNLNLQTTGIGTDFGYKFSWRNADGSNRQDALTFTKDGSVNFGMNIGIGTYTPASRFHLAVAPTATANFPLFALGNAPFDGTSLGYFIGNNSGTVLGVNTYSSFTGDFLNFQSGGISKFKIDASGNITTNGNVITSGNTTSTGNFSTTGNISTSGAGAITSAGGIIDSSLASSTSPTTGAFIVSGGVGIGGDIYAGASINAATAITAGTSLTTPIIYGGSGASSTLTLTGTSNASPSNAYVLLQPTGGRVGIGTTAPAIQLDIASTGSAPGIYLDNYSATSSTNPVLIGRTSRGTTSSPSATLTNDKLLFLGGRGDSGSGINSNSSASMMFVAAEDWSATANGTKMTFFTTQNGTTTAVERMRIADTGNIGIGTTNPTSTLDIVGSSSGVPGETTISGPAVNVSSYGGTNGVNLRYANGTSSLPSAVLSGNIIGQYNFSGYGATNFISSTAAKVSAVATENWSDTTGAAALLFATRPSGSTSASLERMRIDQNGNVGIGTSSPTQPLEVNGTGKFINAGSGGTIYLTTPGGESGMEILGTNRADIRFDGNAIKMVASTGTGMPANTSGLAVATSGYVGVGTSSPGYPLTVSGDISINSANTLRFGATSVCTSTGCTASSDVRLKKNVKPLEDSLNKVLKLQGVDFDYKDKAQFTDKHQVGVIAQEVEKIYPEVVTTDRKTGFKAVAYDHLIAPVIEAIKTLYNRLIIQERKIASVEQFKAESVGKIQRLESDNAQLKKKNAELEERLNKIEKSLNSH